MLLYASKYNDVDIVVDISGRFNLERGIEGRLGKDFLQRIKKNGFIDVKNRRGKLSYQVSLLVLLLKSSSFLIAVWKSFVVLVNY